MVFGMLLSMSMVLCNYTTVEWLVVAFMSLAYFGKGLFSDTHGLIGLLAPFDGGMQLAQTDKKLHLKPGKKVVVKYCLNFPWQEGHTFSATLPVSFDTHRLNPDKVKSSSYQE